MKFAQGSESHPSARSANLDMRPCLFSSVTKPWDMFAKLRLQPRTSNELNQKVFPSVQSLHAATQASPSNSLALESAESHNSVWAKHRKIIKEYPTRNVQHLVEKKPKTPTCPVKGIYRGCGSKHERVRRIITSGLLSGPPYIDHSKVPMFRKYSHLLVSLAQV